MSALRVTRIRITPVAVADPPLLNSVGVHEPYQLRTILEVETDAGITGIGEAYGDDATLNRLRTVADVLPGLDAFDLHGLRRKVLETLGEPEADSFTELIGLASSEKAVNTTVAAFEVPLLDAQGKALGRPVTDLLGGAVRGEVPFSGYLFYRWARHPNGPDFAEDTWGDALDPEGIVAQARRLVDEYGFGSLKLKGGVFAPDEEVDAVLALRDAFPDLPVRIDPNANWTVPTALQVAKRLEGVLEYLEDPVGGIDGMAEVARQTSLPLATNMCVTTFAELPEAVAQGAVRIILADHHFWGGLVETHRLAAITRTFGLALSMHSNTHLGISLAAMTHLAAATPEIVYACDTHTPWQNHSDVIVPGALRFVGGSVPVPTEPGLGVEIDQDALARMHETYRACGIRKRDDVSAMRVVDPSWTGKRPRF